MNDLGGWPEDDLGPPGYVWPTPAEFKKRVDADLAKDPVWAGFDKEIAAIAAPLSPAARVRAMAAEGPLIRLPTTLETLDSACRGGFPSARLVVVGGAPGAGKTSLCTWLGYIWARAGIPVCMLAVDEGPEGLIMRVAQLSGHRADQVESRSPLVLDSLAKVFDSLPLSVIDGDDPIGTIEGAAEHLGHVRDRHYGAAPMRPAVLIVDSIQTCRSSLYDAPTPRERVDGVTKALKQTVASYGFLVLATCELNRGAYRNRDQAQNYNDLAAFKESGGIEYAAQTALVLRSVPDETHLIDVTIPKNRAYKRPTFRLRMDETTAAFAEEVVPELATKAAPSVRDDAISLLRVLRDSPGVAGKRGLRSAAGASGIKMSHSRLDAACHLLESFGAIENVPEGGKPRWYANASKFNDSERA